MKIFINNNTDPYFNLASEEYLLGHSDSDIFMLWRNSPAVILGKNQNAFAEINFSFTNSHGIKVVRRLTGGGAVFHDLGNVNFTFISPAGGELAKGIRAGGLDFGHFTKPVVEALASLGVSAELSGRNDIVAEVITDGKAEKRKISGNAQCAYNAPSGKIKTMHHGTLLFSADLSRMQGALNVETGKLKSKGIKSVRSRVANISDLIPADKFSDAKDTESFMLYIAEYISARFGTPIERFGEDYIAGINELAHEKYSTDLWNLRRFGSFGTRLSRRFDFGTVEISLDVSEGKISGLHIGGDFFGTRDVEILEKELIGTVYSVETVIAQLHGLNIGEYISGAAAKDIAELVCGIK